jgi:hypothetical protein
MPKIGVLRLLVLSDNKLSVFLFDFFHIVELAEYKIILWCICVLYSLDHFCWRPANQFDLHF